MAIFKRTPQISIQDDVLTEIGRRKTEREQARIQSAVTPEKVRAAINSKDWEQLEQLFKADDRFIVNYMGITDEEYAGIDALHDEITELIRNSEITPELVSFMSYYYHRTWIGANDVDVLCDKRIDDANLEIDIVFPNLKWGTTPQEAVDFFKRSELFESRFGHKLFGEVISHLRIENAAEAAIYAQALDSVIEQKGDWNLYQFLQNFDRLKDFKLDITKNQFQKMLANNQNGSVATIIENNWYSNVDNSDFVIAVRAIGQENPHSFTGGSSNTHTNVAKIILEKLPKITKSDIDVIVEQLTLHPQNSALNTILSKAIDRLPSRNGSNKEIVDALIPLNRDGVTTVLIEKGIFTPTAEDIAKFFADSHYGSIEAVTVKGFIPSSQEFDKALADGKEHLVGMFIANGYIPKTVDQVRSIPDNLLSALEERLVANGVKIPSVAISKEPLVR